MAQERKEGADYLDQFSRSPYHFPANQREKVDGVSTLPGSWQPSQKSEEKE